MPTGSKSDIGATAARLTTRTVRNRSGIRIKAGSGNSTNKVYIDETPYLTAGTNDALNGYELVTNQEIVLPPSRFKSVGDVWVIGSASSLAAFWICDGEEDEMDLGFEFDFNSQYFLVIF